MRPCKLRILGRLDAAQRPSSYMEKFRKDLVVKCNMKVYRLRLWYNVKNACKLVGNIYQ